jgi:hypothetical protein
MEGQSEKKGKEIERNKKETNARQREEKRREERIE